MSITGPYFCICGHYHAVAHMGSNCPRSRCVCTRYERSIDFPNGVVGIPNGVTEDQARDALADACKWVTVDSFAGIPKGARYRIERRLGAPAGSRTYYVHRDDLPPEPDSNAELVERMCEELWGSVWRAFSADRKNHFRAKMSNALPLAREHDAKETS